MAFEPSETDRGDSQSVFRVAWLFSALLLFTGRFSDVPRVWTPDQVRLRLKTF
jgi:hypothetical protein